MKSDNAKAIIAMASRLGDNRRPSLSPTEWHRFATVLDDQRIDYGEVFNESFAPSSIPGLPDGIVSKVEALLETAAAATVEAEELGRYGIRTVTILDEDYPDDLRTRLGDLSPPVIYTAGDLSLATGDGVGIVGSRDISEQGKAAAEEIARHAVRLGRSVVSGGARGVDSFAMNAAFAAGGTVIGALADSLQGRIRKSGTLQALDEGTVCLISQQIPSAGFTPHAAMARNKLIYALSTTTVVVAADIDKGGTWSGATEALKKNNGIVAAWTGSGEVPGNRHLIELGAVPLTDVDDLERVLAGTADPLPEQLGLLDSA